jgi:hypothetical protein
VLSVSGGLALSGDFGINAAVSAQSWGRYWRDLGRRVRFGSYWGDADSMRWGSRLGALRRGRSWRITAFPRYRPGDLAYWRDLGSLGVYCSRSLGASVPLDRQLGDFACMPLCSGASGASGSSRGAWRIGAQCTIGIPAFACMLGAALAYRSGALLALGIGAHSLGPESACLLGAELAHCWGRHLRVLLGLRHQLVRR